MKRFLIILFFLPMFLSNIFCAEQNNINVDSNLFVSNTFNNNLKTATEYFKTHKPIIVWDIHGVLMEGYYVKDTLRGFFDAVPTLQQKCLIVPWLVFIMFCDWRIHPQILNLYMQKDGKHKITESYYNILKHTHPDVFATLIRVSNNLYKEMPDIKTVLDQLTIAECKHELLSNIGPRILSDLTAQHTEFFSRFPHQNLINSEEQDGRYVHQKPVRSAYEKAFKVLQTRYPDLKPYDIIFVDDKPKNLNEPHNLGWNTIHFTSVNNLKNHFKNLGLINEPLSHL